MTDLRGDVAGGCDAGSPRLRRSFALPGAEASIVILAFDILPRPSVAQLVRIGTDNGRLGELAVAQSCAMNASAEE
jgi:hypothetical protein